MNEQENPTDEMIDSLQEKFESPNSKGDRYVVYVIGVAAEPIIVGQLLEARMNRKTGIVTVHPISRPPMTEEKSIGLSHMVKPRDGTKPLRFDK